MRYWAKFSDGKVGALGEHATAPVVPGATVFTASPTADQVVTDYISGAPVYGDAVVEERETMVCNRIQAIRAMKTAGVYSAVDAWVDTQSEEVQDYWDNSETWRRNSVLMAAGTDPTTGILTDTQVDTLFRAAMAIEA